MAGKIAAGEYTAPRRLLKTVLALSVALTFAAAAQAAKDPTGLLMDIAKKPVPAYEFKSVLAGGGKVKLSDYKGKVVFLNFWATWCIPCVTEMPSMERLAQKLKAHPFRIVAVNMQEKLSKVRKFIKKLGLTYDIVMDPNEDIAANYNANSLPMTYIIDRNGNIIRRAVGAREWDSPAAVAFFLELAREGTAPTGGGVAGG